MSSSEKILNKIMDIRSIPEAIRLDVMKILVKKGMKKVPKDLAELKLSSIPEKMRDSIGRTLALKGARILPNVLDDKKQEVNPDKLQIAVHYLDVALAFQRDMTAMNWRAQCLRLLHRWDEAIAGFEEIIERAKSDAYWKPYSDVATQGIERCKQRKLEDPLPLPITPAQPAADPEYTQVAVSFAEALVRGNFKKARDLLCDSFKSSITEKNLAQSFQNMISYGQSRVDDVDIGQTLDDWPAKKAGDVGWVYVTLSGSHFSEAIAVTICAERSKLVIRDIEWGRP
jgi:hypothetical protein